MAAPRPPVFRSARGSQNPCYLRLVGTIQSTLRLRAFCPTVLCLLCYLYVSLWRAHNRLVDHEPESNLHALVNPDFPNHKFLIFQPIQHGQGTGNIVSGLLAAHLFGDEYNRTVCVSRAYKSFHRAFRAIHPDAVRYCSNPSLRKAMEPYEGHASLPKKETIELYNYGAIPDECRLHERLASDNRIWYFIGNTYPRWCSVPDGFFFRFYEPRPALLRLLPFQTSERPDPKLPPAPEVVVHLREPDGPQDIRKGLDVQTLEALGEFLKENTTTAPYLVTNNVSYYDFFERYGWNHPQWDVVQHSGLKKRWGPKLKLKGENNTQEIREALKESNLMQMWCDWYTLLQAKQIYHTHSDFSISASHWTNGWSRSLLTYDHVNKTLPMLEESYRRDGEMPRLVDRTREEMNKCGSEAAAEEAAKKREEEREVYRRKKLEMGKMNAKEREKATQKFVKEAENDPHSKEHINKLQRAWFAQKNNAGKNERPPNVHHASGQGAEAPGALRTIKFGNDVSFGLRRPPDGLV